MKRLGISIYPDNASLEENKNYIELAAKYGAKRIFTNLLFDEGGRDKEEVLAQFKELIDHANDHGIEVIADVAPNVFKSLDITYDDLGFFDEMGLAGIRMDEGFSGKEESDMTFNEYDLKVEINSSLGTKYVDNIISYHPKRENLIGCHNFYPKKYTGLSRENFLKTSKQFKDLRIRNAAFVSSQEASFGSWDVAEGCPTLEEHRDLPIEVQAKDLFYSGLVDDVIISNCFPSEDELRRLAELDPEMVTLNVEFIDGASDLDKKIVLEEPHFNRGDASAYQIRSTMSRVKYRGEDFPLFNAPDIIEKGDVVIESSEYGRYAGELYIARQEMKNSGKSNVVAKIAPAEVFLLDYIQSWQKFKFTEKR